ncbi:hypothetical protein SESBI_46576 [Sesbania bispinosa]|nr:hypothetical protein SESBI_46576 [Sesbania bispinosa]
MVSGAINGINLPLYATDEADAWTWVHSSDGSYSSKQGYNWLHDQMTRSGVDRPWRWVGGFKHQKRFASLFGCLCIIPFQQREFFSIVAWGLMIYAQDANVLLKLCFTA